MNETGNISKVAAEMMQLNLTILVISISRWTCSVQKRLTSSELLLFSRYEQAHAALT
ncbi:hypothetical protein DPMN_005135 [Dreissena polymorpha]|uniref:Uncharacterized protein n=1 Tax=Dreissena polymorpha TaxID=45954 RepID=A0A9D4MP33_DREPO|nr:hypothetical protein DPMN_005135 [Dreissena polymorpha]